MLGSLSFLSRLKRITSNSTTISPPTASITIQLQPDQLTAKVPLIAAVTSTIPSDIKNEFAGHWPDIRADIAKQIIALGVSGGEVVG
ncbi:hypothetical protein CGRA01v4_07426 [Colletotrichum graminicola]|nr:hypothetical protein CGRA01v4_07426 [Colletotrichum graminicola]